MPVAREKLWKDCTTSSLPHGNARLQLFVCLDDVRAPVIRWSTVSKSGIGISIIALQPGRRTGGPLLRCCAGDHKDLRCPPKASWCCVLCCPLCYDWDLRDNQSALFISICSSSPKHRQTAHLQMITSSECCRPNHGHRRTFKPAGHRRTLEGGIAKGSP
jgi:hypothetical protein